MKKNILKNSAVQSLIASLICIFLGLLIGYIVLLFINPTGAWGAITAVVKNFFNYSRANLQSKNFGNTLVKTAPLLMCALSVLFAYKVGLFNIGAAGQYVAGVCASIYAALAWGWGWFPCMLLAIVAGAALGAIVGFLKSSLNVNEVISGIMLNWITLYLVNMILTKVKDPASPYTLPLQATNPKAVIPGVGLPAFFANNRYVTLAIPLAVIIAVAIWVVLNKTVFGYELRATGFNKEAARYAGMAEKKNIIVTLAIGGALAGIGAAFLFLTGYQQWTTTQTSVPGMGFNGIAATFLGGLNPIGTIFSSFFIQQITDGGALIDKAIYPSQISDLISALIVYLCGFTMFFRLIIANKLARKGGNK